MIVGHVLLLYQLMAAGSDYIAVVNEVLTFTSTSSQRQCVDVGIVNDLLVEPVEQFTVLINQTGTQQVDQAVVSITDNDGRLKVLVSLLQH